MQTTEYVLKPAALAEMAGSRNPIKRLEFRVDPRDFDTLHTRVDALIDAMADLHRFDRAAFRTKASKDTDLCFAQQVTWYVLRVRWCFPYTLIASYFEHQRNTISYGVNLVMDTIDADPAFDAWIEALPFWVNMDFDAGRLQAISAVFDSEVGTTMADAIKTQQKGRKGAKTGNAGLRKASE